MRYDLLAASRIGLCWRAARARSRPNANRVGCGKSCRFQPFAFGPCEKRKAGDGKNHPLEPLRNWAVPGSGCGGGGCSTLGGITTALSVTSVALIASGMTGTVRSLKSIANIKEPNTITCSSSASETGITLWLSLITVLLFRYRVRIQRIRYKSDILCATLLQ